MKNTDEALGRLIEKGIEVAEQTGKFVIDQAPDLIKEFYMWQLCSNIAMVILMIVSGIILHKIAKKFTEDFDDDLIQYLFHIIFLIFPVILGLVSAYKVLYILLAPKLYLIEHFVK